MLGDDHTPYPNAGILCPESILYLELIFNFAIFAFEADSLARVILISPFDAGNFLYRLHSALEKTTLVKLIFLLHTVHKRYLSGVQQIYRYLCFNYFLVSSSVFIQPLFKCISMKGPFLILYSHEHNIR